MKTGCVGPERLERRDLFATTLTLVGPEAALFEGEQARFTLRLSEPARTAERVLVSTVAGSATYGSDYFAPLGLQVVFAPGQTERSFTIPTLRDAGGPRAEGRETFQVVATPVTRSLGTRSATVAIADYVPPPVFNVTGGRVVEGNDGTTTIEFTVGLSGRYPKPITVGYRTVDGTATVADADYVAATGVLSFDPDVTSTTVAVTINGDRKLEADETFTLALSGPTNATLGRGSAIGTIVNDETDKPGFQVALNFLDGPGGSVPQTVRGVAQQAVTRWARIITGDLPGVPAAGGFIDDFEMSIQMGLLGGAQEGPGDILANARPTAFRNGGDGLPYAGITGLDPADIADPALLLDIITHEMGHAFGFTPGAAVFSQWITGDTFTGRNALREYNSLFGTTAVGVPLEAGSQAHWDETIFGDELMSPVTTGAREYISRITVGALADMGYTVNYAAAEAYRRPTGMAAGITLAVVGSANDVAGLGRASGAARPTSRPAAMRATSGAAGMASISTAAVVPPIVTAANASVVRALKVVVPGTTALKHLATPSGGLARDFARLGAT